MHLITCLLALLCFLPNWARGEQAARLLITVDPKASFTATQLAEMTSADYIAVDQRNPYKALLPVCLDHPVVCIDFMDPTPLIKKIKRLAHRCGYRYVRFMNESLEEAIAQTAEILQTIPTCSSAIYHISNDDSIRLYRLAEKIDRLFTQHGITYWAGRGTLLGAVRHGGNMPWEDYLALHILDSDIEKLTGLEQAFAAEGLVLHTYWKDFYKIFEKEADPIPNPENPAEVLPFRHPVADIFLMSLECRHEAEETYVHQSWNFYWHWNDEKFHYSQIEGIQKVPFGPTQIAIPAHPETVLNKLYGMPHCPELWKTHALEPFWDHRTEQDHLWKGNSIVEIDDFTPSTW